MKIFAAILLLATSLAAVAGPAPPNVELKLSIFGTIEIDAAGTVEKFDLETRLAPAVAQVIGAHIRTWRFEPILVDGRAVPARTRMQIHLTAVPEGGDYKMQVDSVHFGGPRRQDSSSPRIRYPVEALRKALEAHVLLALRIDELGRVTDVHAYQTSLGQAMPEHHAAKWRVLFERNAIRNVEKWRFEPGEYIGGKPVGTSFLVPVQFRIVSGQRGARDDWRSFVPGPVVPAPWHDGDAIGGVEQLVSLQEGDTRSTSSLFRLRDGIARDPR